MSPRAKLWLGGVVAFFTFCIAAWRLAGMLGLQSKDAWMLRGGLLPLLVAVAGVLIYTFRDRLLGDASAAAAAPGVADDIDAMVAAAEKQLAASRAAGKTAGRSIGAHPAVVVLGPEGSAKTTTVVRSGLEPELLAGDVFRGETVAPTPAVNLWFAEGTVFAEAGGPMVGEPDRWARLAQHLTPRRLSAALGRGGQAPRAALVCFSCEELTKAGAGEAVPAAARALRQRLVELAQRFGVRLPVYVLFTKADRLPYFGEYLAHLTREEAREVVGTTLPSDEGAAGSYADREAARVSAALDALFLSLARRRLELLPRESTLPKRALAYEFPREFRKAAPLVTQFLVELCRPSQLQVSPFLRGFYFTGVQAVLVRDVAPAAAQQTAAAAGRLAVKATGVFDARAVAAAAAAPAAQGALTRKIPRWTFLERLLPDVVLRDEAARAATSGGTRVNFLRRALLGVAIALPLIVALGLTVSFVQNRRLERETADLARAAAAAVAPAQAELPAADALRRLDSLRATVVRLRDYERDGAPWRYRWGLYSGDAILPEARRAYFAGLDRIGLGPTRQALAEALRGLPDTPGATADYGPTYETLKAHLITTTEPARSTPEFLSPVLLRRWLAGRDMDAERSTLARRQLDFYADELRRHGDPYGPGAADAAGVGRARAFLAKFAGVGEGIYQFMLSEAAKGQPPARDAQRVPGSVGYVSDPYEVPGAFIKGGWTFMQNAFKSADRYFTGESWVVGEQAGPPVDRAAVIAQLRARYAADYVKHWRAFVRSASVARYANVREAAQKLTVLSGNQSPLLALLSIAAQNTDVDSATAAAFQPVHAVTPPKVTDKLIGETNGGYVNALVALQSALEAAAAAPPGQGDAAAAPAAQSAQQAKVAARQLAQGFRIDPEAHLESAVQKLLEDPIANAEPLLKSFGATELNAGGKSFCGTFRGLMAKYPFNPNPAAPQATLAEVNTVFRPLTGALWTMYAATLQNALVKQGTQYVPKPGGTTTLSPAFVEFFNRAAAVTDALYKEGAAEPRLTFSVKPLLSAPASAVSITVDGQTATSTPNSAQTRQMEWPGAGVRDGRIAVTLGGADVTLLSYEGPWSAFRLFQEAEAWTTAGQVHRLEWTLRTRGQTATLADGTPVKVAAELNLGATPPVFRRGYFAGLSCVSEVAR